MKLAICAGPATTGKTSVLRHVIRKLLAAGERVAFLKLDVQYADEDELLAKEFGIPTRKVYSGELCPDHCNVMVLGDALRLGRARTDCDVLLVETAGLCLRCSPYVDGGLGMVRAGGHQRHEPAAEGRPDALAGRRRRGHQDRPRLAGRARGVPGAHPGRRPGGADPRGQRPARHRHRPAGGAASWRRPTRRRPLLLRGNPPVGTCTICVGKKEIGWQSHFGVVRAAGQPELLPGGVSHGRPRSTSTTPPPRRSTRACARRCGRTSTQCSATPRACTRRGGEAHEAVEQARAAGRRSARRRSPARSSSPPAAPRPTTWRSRGVRRAPGAAGCHVITSAIEHPAVLETVPATSSGGASRSRYLPVDGDGIVRPRRRSPSALRPEHAAGLGHGGQQRGRHDPADRRAGRARHARTARCSTPTPCRPRARCRWTCGRSADRPALALGAQAPRAQGRRRAVRARRRRARAARARRRPGARPALGHGERGRHRRLRAGGASSRAPRWPTRRRGWSRLRDHSSTASRRRSPTPTSSATAIGACPATCASASPGQEGEAIRLLLELDEPASPSRRAARAAPTTPGEPSYVLTAMGFDPIRARGSLRITLGRFTPSDEDSTASRRASPTRRSPCRPIASHAGFARACRERSVT